MKNSFVLQVVFTPRFHSSFGLAMTKMFSRDDFSKRSSSCSSLSNSRSGIPSSSKRIHPVVVLLPLSTCPHMTMDMGSFSSLMSRENNFRSSTYNGAQVVPASRLLGYIARYVTGPTESCERARRALWRGLSLSLAP